VIRRSPLDGVALVDGLRELPFLAQLGVRADRPPASLPTEPNTVAGDATRAALWLGPGEWLVVGPPGREHELQAELLADGATVIDVSANRTTLELRGPRARELLEFGCPIDLDPRVFGPGHCAQTLLARANVLIWFVTDDPEPVYRLLVRPSFAAYVAASPGGPTHVLLDDEVAEHIPGCNMAFRREALHAIGGFDPIFRAAGDDVDLCWRLQNKGYKIGFSPAAVVWHFRRNTVRDYLKQQRGYGKAENREPMRRGGRKAARRRS